MKKIHLLSSAIVVGVMLAASGNIFNTQLFASNITRKSQLKSSTEQGQRIEIIHKFMKEDSDSATAAPKIVKKLDDLRLVPPSISAASYGVLRSTINKVCELYENSELKNALMHMDEGTLTNFIATLDPSRQFNAGEKSIFKDLFKDIKDDEYKNIP